MGYPGKGDAMKTEALTPARVERLLRDLREVLRATGRARAVAFLRDPEAPRGFCLRVTRSGESAFYLVQRAFGRKVWVRIGDASLPLKQARDAARVRAGELAKGIDPNEAKREAATRRREERAETEREASVLTVAELVREYISTRTLAPRTAREYARTVEHDIASSRLGSMKAAEVVQGDVRAFVRALAKRGKHQADRALVLVRYAFRWGAREEITPGVKILTNEPTSGVERATVTADRVRRRKLVNPKAHTEAEAFAEVKQFWLGAEAMRPVPRAFVRLLLLLGLRRGEAAAATWGDIRLDGDAPSWHVPAEHRKIRITRRDPEEDSLDVPLAPLAVRILGEIRPESPAASAPVFPRLHAGSVADSMWQHTGITDIRLHDLRRTTGSAILRLGGPPHVLTDVLGHRPRGLADSDEAYLQGRRVDELRLWLRRWAEKIEALVTGEEKAGKVTPFRGRRR